MMQRFVDNSEKVPGTGYWALVAGYVVSILLFLSIPAVAFGQYNKYESMTSQTLTPPRHSPHQNVKPEDRVGNESNPVYQKVEKDPQYPGGAEAMIKFMTDNLIYPWKARARKIHGRVYVYFEVRTDGRIMNMSIRKGIGGGCDEEAMRVIRMMPDWIPGENEGKKVNAGVILPIRFETDTIPQGK